MVKFKYDQTDMHLSYDKSRRLPQETITLWMETLSKYLPRDSIKTIIDLGCGTGRFTKSLSDHFSAKVYGIDLSWKMLTVAKQALMSPMIGFVQGSAESLPLADGSADMIFLSMVYHHIQDKSQAILEFKRALKAGGFLSIRTPTIDNLDSCLHLQFFPTARQISLSCLPAIGSLTDFLQGYGFVLKGHSVVHQLIAENHLECFEKINLRGYSDLASIPDEEFNEGLARMKRYCFEQEKDKSVFEDVDLFVFHVA